MKTVLSPEHSISALPNGNELVRNGRHVRVAAVLDTWIVSGPGRQLAALSTALRRSGIELRIIMFQRQGRAPSPFIAYLDRLGVSYQVLADYGPLDTATLGRLNKALAEYKPDIVQTHGYRPTALIAALRLRTRPWRWIGFFHGATQQDLKDRFYNRLESLLLPLADRLVVLSEEHRHWFARIRERVRLIHNASFVLPSEQNPIDLSAFRKGGDVLVGVVARLSYEKGVDLLIDAAAHLRRSGVLVAVVIAGDGPEEPALRQQVVKLGLTEHIHFLGRVANVMSLYRQLDLLAVPSRAGAEGLPNVLLEALQADVPVIATEVAAVPEVLSDPEAGILVRPGDVHSLVSAIRVALSSGTSEQATAARRKVLDRFSLAKRVQTHIELYEEVLPNEHRCRTQK